LPGDEGTDIHCQIIDYTIRSNGRSALYEALSYAWGEPTHTREIYVQHACDTEGSSVDPSFLEVTNNLYAALSRLRDPDLPRLLWADAVCIDQQNLQERSDQDRLMASIYSSAIRVIVWLGEEADDSALAFASMEEVAILLLRSRDHERLGPIGLHGYSSDSRLLKSFTALLERPWFDRVWVSRFA
jgi:hypothetical protein